MKTLTLLLTLTVLAIVRPTALASETPELKVVAADHIEFTPPALTAWNVERLNEESEWVIVAGPFFGQGEPVQCFLPKGSKRPSNSPYRLAYLPPETTGSAPLALASNTIVVRQGTVNTEYIFLTRNTGFVKIDEWHAKLFQFTYSKTGPLEGKLKLLGKDGSNTDVTLTYSNRSVGSWKSKVTAGPGAGTATAGIFSSQSGRISPLPAAVKMPLNMEGRPFLLTEGGQITRLDFSDPQRGSAVLPNGTVRPFTYSYDVKSAAQAHLTIFFGTTTMEYDMDIDTPASGSYKKKISLNGTVISSGISGGFTSPATIIPRSTPNCPPSSLSDRSIRINGSKLLTLRFYADGTGQQECIVSGVIQITPFLYDYAHSGANGAEIAITFPGATSDRIDTYHMDFDADCDGTYTRRDYQAGNSQPASTGSFNGS